MSPSAWATSPGDRPVARRPVTQLTSTLAFNASKEHSMNISCIGVGAMGGAVARRLATGGVPTTVFDPDQDAMDSCLDAGARSTSSLESAVAEAEVVLTSLPTTALVLDTVERLARLLPPGRIVMDISTIDPHTARQAATACEERDLRFVACALGKTPAHAENGRIPLFVGGDDGAITELEDVLARIGEKTYRFADVEGATTFKLVSNFIGMSNVAALAEGLALAQRAGIPTELFAEALADTGAVSFQSDVRLPWMLAQDWRARFGVDLAVKDVGLAVEAAQMWALDTPVGSAALTQLRTASEKGFGGEDAAAVARLYAPPAAP